MKNNDFESILIIRTETCEWCDKMLHAGVDAILLPEEDEDYYFCEEACVKGYTEGTE
jgi:ribosomal protein L24E